MTDEEVTMIFNGVIPSNYVEIDSMDESLVYNKKYVNGAWVDCLPPETGAQKDDYLVLFNNKDDIEIISL